MASSSGAGGPSEHYVTFVNMLFVIVLALGVERSASLFLTPLTFEFFLLVTTFAFVALSWVYYHKSVDALAYTGSRKSWCRFSLDVMIAFSYTGLMVSINNVPQYGLVLSLIYVLYAVHGFFTVYEYGWFRTDSLKPNSTPSFWLLFSIYFLIPYYGWSIVTPPLNTWLVLLYPVGIVASRYLRHARGSEITLVLGKMRLQPLPVVAIDVDGVLADQVPHVLAKAEKEKGVKMAKQQITEWDTKVAEEPFDKLISRYLLDPEFVRTMPEVPKAKEAVDRIRRRARVILASSRPKETEGDTKAWFREKFGWNARFVNTTRSGKSGLQAQVLIDDNIDNVRNFVVANPQRRAVLMSQPWNTRTEIIADLVGQKRIAIASDWDEASEELMR